MEIILFKNVVEMLIEKVGENIKIVFVFINDFDLFLRDKGVFVKGSFF